MDTLRKAFGWTCLIAVILLFTMMMALPASCTSEQFDEFDQGMQAGEGTTEGIHQIIESPAGQFIPPPWRGIAETVIGGALAIFGVYSENKARIRTAVLRSVVQAVDSTDDTKDSVASNLEAAGLRKTGDALIAELRSKK